MEFFDKLYVEFEIKRFKIRNLSNWKDEMGNN